MTQEHTCSQVLMGLFVSLLLGGDATVVDEKTGETRQLSMEEMVQKALTQELLLQLKL